jgi:hypothetical protein
MNSIYTDDIIAGIDEEIDDTNDNIGLTLSNICVDDLDQFNQDHDFNLEKENKLKASNEANKKFSAIDWTTIESQKHSEHDLVVYECLKLLGTSNDAKAMTKKLLTFGNLFYTRIRPNLIKYHPIKKIRSGSNVKTITINHGIVIGQTIGEVEDITAKKKGGKQNQKKGLSADEIRLNRTATEAQELITELLNTFNINEMTYANGLNSQCIEIRGITLMYCAWFILHADPEKYAKISKRSEVYEVIVGIQKFLSASNNYVGRSMFHTVVAQEVSEMMRIDLGRWLEALIEKYPIDGIKLYEIAPRLIIYSKFDNAIPSVGINPRKSQCDVMHVIQNHPDKFLINYNAMINSGKTSFAAISLPMYVHKHNQSFANNKLQLIVCCNIPSVRLQVCAIAYACKIKFGLAHVEEEGTIKITNHWSFSNDAERVLIVSGLDAAYKLLKADKENIEKNGGSSSYILFHDEPTVGADEKGSGALWDNMGLFTVMPDKAILSSATMPSINELDNFLNYHLARFPGTHVETVYSPEIQIGIDVFTFTGESMVPHSNCKNAIELNKAIDTIKNAPFLGRLFTPFVAKKLWDKINHLPNIPNLANIFNDVSNLKPDMVRIVSTQMLQCLADTKNDALIEEICKINYGQNNVIEVDSDNDDDIVFKNDDDDDKPYVLNSINLNKLSTMDAHKLSGLTLIATIDPIDFCNKNFNDILELLKEKGYDSVEKIIEIYERDLKIFNEQSDRISSKIKSEDIKSQKLQELQNLAPKIQFPLWAQINTRDHMLKFANKHKAHIDRSNVRSIYSLELHPTNFNVPDWVMLLLWCGVGIYAPDNQLLDQNYTSHIHSLMTFGSLAIVISDKTICYGSNYPFRCVCVTKEFASVHSIYTLFQYLGRAGRVGLAWKAVAFISDETAKFLIDFIHSKTNSITTELVNMNKTFNEYIDDEKQQEINRISKEKELEQQRIIKLEQDKIRLNEIQKKKERSDKLKEKQYEEQLEKEKIDWSRGSKRNESNNEFRRNESNDGFRRNESNNGFRRNEFNDGFRRNESNNGFRRNESNDGFRRNESNDGFRRNESNDGFRRNESNDGFRRNESNDGFRRNESNSEFKRGSLVANQVKENDTNNIRKEKSYDSVIEFKRGSLTKIIDKEKDNNNKDNYNKKDNIQPQTNQEFKRGSSLTQLDKENKLQRKQSVDGYYKAPNRNNKKENENTTNTTNTTAVTNAPVNQMRTWLRSNNKN